MTGAEKVGRRLEMITAATNRAWRLRRTALDRGDMASADYWKKQISIYRAQRSGIVAALDMLGIEI